MKLMIYAHYDADNKIKPYVVYMLNKLKNHYDDIIFVTNSQLEDAELNKIRALVVSIHQKDNVGYDFGMWKLAIEKTDINLYDELTLVNSSIYGPVYSMHEVYSHMDKVDCDFWGITESYELDRHLQTYFLVFKRNVIQSDAFKSFWSGVLEYSNKLQTIRSYEIGLTQWLLQHGFKPGVYCSWQRLVKRCRHEKVKKLRKPMNPTIAYGLQLLKLESPFVKLELLRDNPYKVNLNEVRKLIVDAHYPVSFLLSGKETCSNNVSSGNEDHCPLCGSDGKQAHKNLRDRLAPYSPEKWRIWRCKGRKCGISWLKPIPTQNELEEAFQANSIHGESFDDDYFAPQYSFAGWLLLSACRIMQKVMRIEKKRENFYLHALIDEKPGRLLEVGCGCGDRLVALRNLGWDVERQEVDPVAVNYCVEKQGLLVSIDRFEELKANHELYDIILMSHFLECVQEPMTLLKDCLRLLKPGGKLLLTTPNNKSLGHFVYKKYWFSLNPPRHSLIYTSSALKKLLFEAGFDKVKVSTVAINHEHVALHSLDIMVTSWTYGNVSSRINNELLPMMLQNIALIFSVILPGSGEECFAEACKTQV